MGWWLVGGILRTFSTTTFWEGGQGTLHVHNTSKAKTEKSLLDSLPPPSPIILVEASDRKLVCVCVHVRMYEYVMCVHWLVCDVCVCVAECVSVYLSTGVCMCVCVCRRG